MKTCNRLCEAATVALSAFSVGVLLTIFLPPCVLVGASAIASIAFGAICLFSK